MKPHSLKDLHWATQLSAFKRQALSIIVAFIIGVTATLSLQAPLIMALLTAWCAYCIVDLTLAGLLIRHSDATATRRRAQWYDPGAFFLLIIVVIAGCASLVAVTLAIDTGNDLRGMARWAHLPIVFLSLAGAWLLIQVKFAFHYARVYYRPLSPEKEPTHGLAFPGDQEPDYLDFFYYAAVVGMTSQVSDVAASSRHMRRLTLFHGLLSFAFNLIVLAIAVNVLASHLG